MYEVPDPKKSIAQNRFAFKIGDKEYHLSRMKFLTLAQADKIDDDASPARIMAAIAPDERTAKALNEVPIEHLEGLFEAWQADSGVSVGESEGSES